MKQQRKLIMITMDGVRSDALAAARTPYLDKFLSEGSHSMRGRTIYPCCTLPAHTSLFYGIEAARHGVVDNESYPRVKIKNFHSLFDKAWEAGYRTGAYISWFQLGNIYGEREKLHALHFDRFYQRKGTTIVGAFYPGYKQYVRGLRQFLATTTLDLVHFYLEAPDVWGHFKHWMSPEYMRAIETSDMLLGQILEEIWGLPAYRDCAVLITTDHGGIGADHVEDRKENRTTWFIAKGPGIRERHTVEEFYILDFVPTVARYLGLQPAAAWEGSVLDILA